MKINGFTEMKPYLLLLKLIYFRANIRYSIQDVFARRLQDVWENKKCF